MSSLLNFQWPAFGFAFLFATTVSAQPTNWNGPAPAIVPELQSAARHFEKYDVVLAPDKDEAEYWAGAPSVARDAQGVFWLAARMRSPEFARSLRGYEIRLLRSTDGIHFERVKSIRRADVPIPGFERPALRFDSASKKFKLYACGPWREGPWAIIKFADADSPEKIDPTTARPVIQAPAPRYERDVSVTEYKDPVILQAEGKYHCYVIGYIRRNERIFHYISDDGEKWQPVGDVNAPVMDLTGWHNFFVRPSSVLPLGVGYLFVYEGSSTQWFDPVYNIGIGLGFTFDLHHVTELTPASPLALSTTPGSFHTFRYSDWHWVNGEIWVYAEVSKANSAHEIRLFRIPVAGR
ncbi:MAG: hypothetical protein KBH45_16060 [Verrucomicrobia bacterium]|nr:hypothetical protein [Verrucomicrobiota bacterium]